MLTECAIKALSNVAERAKAREAQDVLAIIDLLPGASRTGVGKIVDAVFQNRRVTMSFHPDRPASDGITVIEHLIEDGRYLSQFVTGTTNGGRTAYPGGDRDLWEKALFGGAYHAEDVSPADRPKYGALNLLDYLDGATPRFGSCHFVLKPEVSARSTFTFGDSHTNPKDIGTRDAFLPVLRALLDHAQTTGRLLAEPGFDAVSAAAHICAPESPAVRMPNRRIDGPGEETETHLEAQAHGEIDLSQDIERLCVDGSYRNSEHERKILTLCALHKIPLVWLPARAIELMHIPDEFRGPAMRPLAERILMELCPGETALTAERIGRASRLIHVRPEAWADLGTEAELFQFLKRLWHVLVKFGTYVA